MRYLRAITSLLLIAGLAMAGCDDWTDVQNPGGIQDVNLDNEVVFEALVFGMEEDFSLALSEIARDASVMADEWTFVGSSSTVRNYQDGLIRDDQVGGHWNRMQRARWVAEDGIERMLRVWGPEVMGESPLGVRARLMAGFANRLKGELFCEAVFDGGPAEPHTAALERAEEHFDEAVQMAQRQGLTDEYYAALGARASVRAWLGDWAGAEADAAEVPVDFSHEAMFWADGATPPGPGSRGMNFVWRENFHRQLFTVAESRWAEISGEPRAPSDSIFRDDGSIHPADDGLTPWIRQLKYPEPGSDIPLVQGTELLLLRAEAQLRAGDVGGAETLINQNRDHYGLDPISLGDEAEAWAVLKDERAAEVWLEARRFWDLRRWHEEGRDDFLADRDPCIPISDRERRSNPNLS